MLPSAGTDAPTRLSQVERFSFGSAQFANVGGPQLVSALANAERGDMRDWGNFGDYIMSGSDGWLAGKFLARSMRVAQADFRVVPVGNSPDAKLAAQLCDKAIRRIPKLTSVFLQQLDAIALGSVFHFVSWGNVDGFYMPTSIEWVHLRRFRFDLQWRPRLWDSGQTPGPDGYGRPIDAEPAQWVWHTHATRGTYPGLYGELRKCSKLWLFMSWCSRWWIQNSEKYGSPFIHATVPKDMKQSSRTKVLEGLQRIANDHVAIAEEGTELHVETAAAASRAFENFSEFLRFAKEQLTEQVLGTSDAAGPGSNGSNAAVTTRMGALTDPIMIADGAALADTWRDQVFKWVVYFNRHLFAGALPETPELRFLTADDEVEVDQGDKAQEAAAPATPPPAQASTTQPVQEVAALTDSPLALALTTRRARLLSR